MIRQNVIQIITAIRDSEKSHNSRKERPQTLQGQLPLLSRPDLFSYLHTRAINCCATVTDKL